MEISELTIGILFATSYVVLVVVIVFIAVKL